MNDRERRLIDIAAAVSDGSDVDWAAAESIADTAAERCVVRDLQMPARVRRATVVTVPGADVVDGRTGLWMEFIRGSTLGDAVAANGPFGARETAGVGIGLCRALAPV